MTGFEKECLKELLSSLQRAETALIALLGYNQGKEDGEQKNATGGVLRSYKKRSNE